MSDNSVRTFYFSKVRTIHVAINIAMSPVVFHLAGIWTWPPGSVQIAFFVATFIAAAIYVKSRWMQPAMIIDDKGIRGKKNYEFDSIEKATVVFRSLKLLLNSSAGSREEVVNIAWASKSDAKQIIELINSQIEVQD
ncbi:MAG: hypothetical protein ACI8P9_003808 [Parasphingorhabdus sp.]|jgi:hypothetical protein